MRKSMIIVWFVLFILIMSVGTWWQQAQSIGATQTPKHLIDRTPDGQVIQQEDPALAMNKLSLTERFVVLTADQPVPDGEIVLHPQVSQKGHLYVVKVDDATWGELQVTRKGATLTHEGKRVTATNKKMKQQLRSIELTDQSIVVAP